MLHQDAAVTGRLDDPGRGLRLGRRGRQSGLDGNEQDEQGDGRDTHGA